MGRLQNRIPPPILASLVAVGMGALAWFSEARWGTPALRLGLTFVLAVLGGLFGVPAFAAFRSAGTTIDPVHIERASQLVTTGIYAITRNPMYVSLTLLILAWGVYLGVLAALLGPLAFAVFVTVFQILPEERALTARFGAAYDTYRARVRRWL
ncbi:MAG: isoprenylcysteine carboxylmethyltransferase family protein [Deltaproteobacteria bacterium]|nr:isoprenylcysteine carboxylmethyltransferase family protein [Nannocystaceae bacterium]